MKRYKDSSSQVEFYLIDAFEIFHYLPIYWELLKMGVRARIVAEPCEINTGHFWFDYDTAVRILEENDIRYATVANENADIAVTTQRASCLAKYARRKCHLQYGISFLKNIFVLSRETCKGFDYRLLISLFAREKVSPFMDAQALFTVGYPKYDSWFRNPSLTQAVRGRLGLPEGKPVLVYLPTWDEHASITAFGPEIGRLRERFTIVTKPHHCTSRLPEKQRDRDILRAVSNVVVDGNFPFAEVCACADMYLVDARSGAALEALYLNPQPALLLNAPGRTRELFEPEIFEVAPVLESPEQLFPAVEDFFRGCLRVNVEKMEYFLGPRDGLSSERAADVLIHLLETTLAGGGVTGCASKPTPESDALSSALPRRRRDAIAWLRQQSAQGGVNVSDRERVPYPEVTGYFVPTLLQWGETDLALQYARWLLTMQRADGAFLGPGMELPFAFDTGQIIRGLAAAVPHLPEAAPALERACEWLIGASSPEGRLPLPENMAAWQLGEGRGHVNEAIHLYVLPGLLQAAEALNIPRYADFARRSLDYYIRHCNLTNFYAPNMLLHFYCYIQEALFDMGAEDVCRAGMRLLEELQGGDGRVPAYADVDWVCTPGQIQAALVWLKLGDTAHGLPALRLGTSLQRPSGGFPGSAGLGAAYFPDAEISWPVKFWLDALHVREEQQGRADAHSRPVKLAAPRVPEEGELPLIALEQSAVTCLETLVLSPDAEAAGGLSRVAASVPVLLEWGRREAALTQAKALAAHSDRFLAESEGAEDFLFTLAALIRAFRQPEIRGRFGDDFLKGFCLPVFHRQRLAAEDNPGLFAAFGELAQAGEALQESAWTDCAHVWARRQRNLSDQRPSVRLVGDAVGVGLLLAPENGLALLRRVAADVGLPAAGSPEQPRYEHLMLALARGAWRLGDDTLGTEAFRCGLAARVAAQSLPWQAESAEAFLAAFSAMQRCRFTQQFSHFLDSIDANDGRLAFVKAHLPAAPEAKILDMGTAKGRYVRRLLQAGFQGRLTGQDVHNVFAAHMPPGVAAGVGTMLRSGWNDASWDAVMLCEVLEHCVDLPAALRELRRILRPGGTLVIIDKNLDRLPYWPGGIPPWEQWFDADRLAAMLRDTGFAVTALERRVPYEGRNDGLFFGLAATKGSA